MSLFPKREASPAGDVAAEPSQPAARRVAGIDFAQRSPRDAHQAGASDATVGMSPKSQFQAIERRRLELTVRHARALSKTAEDLRESAEQRSLEFVYTQHTSHRFLSSPTKGIKSPPTRVATGKRTKPAFFSSPPAAAAPPPEKDDELSRVLGELDLAIHKLATGPLRRLPPPQAPAAIVEPAVQPPPSTPVAQKPVRRKPSTPDVPGWVHRMAKAHRSVRKRRAEEAAGVRHGGPRDFVF